jgi:phage FluMu protein Com
MKIRCKKTKRFLVEIEVESYLENLRKIGIKQELPLRITLPCPRCHKTEVYDVYENRYVFVENK